MWGKAFSDEYDLKGAHRHEKRGDLSMANHGPNTNGSQLCALLSFLWHWRSDKS